MQADSQTMTANQQLLDALNGAFTAKFHSLAQYILDAKPFVPAGMEPTRQAIEAIAAADRSFADRLAGVIEALEGVPQLAIFSPEVASLNYLALDYLAGVLLKDLRGQLATFEKALGEAEDVPAAHAVLAELVDASRNHVAALESLVRNS